MSFARSRARKNKKQAGGIDKKARQEEQRAKRSVKRACVYELYMGKITRTQALHNLSACFLLSMNECYGFGAGKLMQLHHKMQNEFDCIVGHYVSVAEIERFLADEIGMRTERAENHSKINYYGQIKLKAVKEMSAAFLMALLDEFGFKARRLSRAYAQVCDLSDRVFKKETTYEEIHERLKVIMERGKYPSEGRFKAIAHTRIMETA